MATTQVRDKAGAHFMLHFHLSPSDHFTLLKAWSRFHFELQVISLAAAIPEMLLLFRPSWISCILLLLITGVAFCRTRTSAAP
jgi:hypothetical protein